MLPSHLLKTINWLMAAMMTFQPILGAIPPELVRPAPAESTHLAEVDAAPAAAEPLTVTVPAPLSAAGEAEVPVAEAPATANLATQPSLQQSLQQNILMIIFCLTRQLM